MGLCEGMQNTGYPAHRGVFSHRVDAGSGVHEYKNLIWGSVLDGSFQPEG